MWVGEAGGSSINDRRPSAARAMRGLSRVSAKLLGSAAIVAAAAAASTSPLPAALSSEPFRDGMGGNEPDGDEFTEMSDWSQTTSMMTTRQLANSSSQLLPFQANHSDHFQPARAPISDQESIEQGLSSFMREADSGSIFGSLFSHIDKQWKFAEIILIIVISAILNLVTVVGNIMVLISFKMDRS